MKIINVIRGLKPCGAVKGTMFGKMYIGNGFFQFAAGSIASIIAGSIILIIINTFKILLKKHKLCVVLTLLFILLIGSASLPEIAESAGQVQEINARQLSEMMSKSTNLVLIDISTEGEYNEAHIIGSLRGDMGLMRIQTEQYLNSIRVKKSDTIVLTCETGRKSYRTARFLLNAGYKNVYNLAGGKIDWARNKYDLVAGKDK